VLEKDDAYEVRASLTGAKPDDIEVTVQGERVTIRAEVRSGEQQRGENWLMREQRFGTMQRTITLPSPVSSENAEARIEHGVLTLRLPKLQGAQAKRIAVSTTASGASTSSGATPTSSSSTESTGVNVTEESSESFPASNPPS
jgi:HSP20 family protein